MAQRPEADAVGANDPVDEDQYIEPDLTLAAYLRDLGVRAAEMLATGVAGPKYLNTTDTPQFHKGAQLFGVVDELLAEGAVPVIVEGPIDAVAVTIASAGLYLGVAPLGVAPLGTAPTDEQSAQLAAVDRDPIVATDADMAGQVAAERDFWMLTLHGMDPGYSRFPDGLEPTDVPSD